MDLGKDQIEKYANKFIPLIEPEFCCLVADEQNKLVAFGVMGMSMAEAMRKSRGRLFPTGWIHVLKSLKKNDAVDMFLIAVDPALQGVGLNSIIMTHLWEGSVKRGIINAETGPMLEMNEKILSQWRALTVIPHKRRRCFVKKIG